MKKILVLTVLVGLGGLVFAQTGMDFGIGYQYGTAKIFEKSEIRREITEPGLLLNFRTATGTFGYFFRFGALFPSSVTEGKLTLDYGSYDYIFFLNIAVGPSFSLPLGDRFEVTLDLGLSLNDLCYGGSYTDDITTSWAIKIGNLGSSYWGTTTIHGARMEETYNDMGIGVLGNLAIRFFFTRTIFLELGAAASFDFLRIRSFEFSADVGSANTGHFPSDAIDPNDHDKIILEEDFKFDVFKQFTFIPSIIVGFRL
jgi:hypothetical protein